MNNENEVNECTDDSCLHCQLVEEFRFLVAEENASWEDALRYVLHVASEEQGITEQELGEILSESYTDGFEDGLQTATRKAANLLNELVDYTDEQIADYRAEREAELNGEFDDAEAEEEIEDISDEEFDKIAKLIRESQGRN